jgi:hypothetical protein
MLEITIRLLVTQTREDEDAMERADLLLKDLYAHEEIQAGEVVDAHETPDPED